MVIVNGCQLLTIITKRFILDVAAVLDPPLIFCMIFQEKCLSCYLSCCHVLTSRDIGQFWAICVLQ